MTTHFLTVAIRNLIKYKTQTLVSIIGLAIGLAASSLAGIWLKYNLTYDAHWPEAERTYCVMQKTIHDTHFVAGTPNPLATYLKEHLPEAEATCRLSWEGYVQHNDNDAEYLVTGVDTCSLRMFPIHIIDGNPDFHLQPDQYALSESMAIEMFGTTDVIGKQLKNTTDERIGTITTLFRDVEGHSNFPWTILTAQAPIKARTYTSISGEPVSVSPWNQRGSQTFIRIHKGTDVEKMMEKLDDDVKKDGFFDHDAYRCILLTDFKNREGQYIYQTIQLEHIRIFCLMGGLIVLAAILNYLILYAIRIRMRVREMTLRKVHGASKLNLTALLMTELVVLLVCTYPVGMVIVELTFPAFRELSDIHKEPLGFFYREGTLFMLAIMGVSLLLSLIVIHVQCRKTLQAGLRKDNLRIMRKVCLGIQLVISIGFIFCAMTMYRQLNYLHHSPETGFKNTEIGFVPDIMGGAEAYETFYQHMKQIPYIDAHAIYQMPFNVHGAFMVEDWEGKPADAPPVQFKQGFIDKDIFEHFGLQLLVGSIPEKEDTSGKFIINETVMKTFGWTLDEVLQKTIMGGRIAGVIKDIRLAPMEKALPTLYFTNWPKGGIKNIVFTYEGDFEDVRKKLTDYFKEKCPHNYFIVSTPAEQIEGSLRSERALLKCLVVASMVSVLISLFGIFSLVNLSCERRRKEMALRKIHGAKVKDIAHLFAKEYAIVLAISAIVAFPIGYAIMKEWMMNYVMQTDIPAWMYIGILLLVSVLITLCVGYRVWRAANENPADVVKSE